MVDCPACKRSHGKLSPGIYECPCKAQFRVEKNPAKKKPSQKNRLPENHGGTLTQYPSGRWGFAGSVDSRLAHVDLEGNTPTAEQMENARQFGPRLAKVKTRSWATKQDAIDAAHALGLEVIGANPMGRTKPKPKHSPYDRAQRRARKTARTGAPASGGNGAYPSPKMRRDNPEWSIVPNDPKMNIKNVEQLPRGTGARYLEIMDSHIPGEHIAVQWRRSIPKTPPKMGHALVEFQSKKNPTDSRFPYTIRQLVSGHWEDTFYDAGSTQAAAVKKMKELQKESRRMGFEGTEGYDLAVFHGRKKVAETKRPGAHNRKFLASASKFGTRKNPDEPRGYWDYPPLEVGEGDVGHPDRPVEGTQSYFDDDEWMDMVGPDKGGGNGHIADPFTPRRHFGMFTFKGNRAVELFAQRWRDSFVAEESGTFSWDGDILPELEELASLPGLREALDTDVREQIIGYIEEGDKVVERDGETYHYPPMVTPDYYSD